MRFILLIFILLLGNQASSNAVGDVFFCGMRENAEWMWEEGKLQKYSLENFKFTIVDKNQIRFGKGGFFDNVAMDIEVLNSNILTASSSAAKVALDENKFNYSMTLFEGVVLITASCDKF